MLDINKYISSDLCEACNWTGKFRRTFLSLQLRSTEIVGWPYPGGKVCVTAWHVTSRNQGLSSNDQGRQRRETLGTRLSVEQFKALFHLLNRRDKFVCLATGDEKTLIYHTAVLVARKVKILPSNPLVVVVSPLNALIADHAT